MRVGNEARLSFGPCLLVGWQPGPYSAGRPTPGAPWGRRQRAFWSRKYTVKTMNQLESCVVRHEAKSLGRHCRHTSKQEESGERSDVI
ncbi:hypothetical protein NL676_011784 [Syzygium grande]|nr:hypothetical protein NL676_011784 [Syzygium grande]